VELSTSLEDSAIDVGLWKIKRSPQQDLRYFTARSLLITRVCGSENSCNPALPFIGDYEQYTVRDQTIRYQDLLASSRRVETISQLVTEYQVLHIRRSACKSHPPSDMRAHICVQTLKVLSVQQVKLSEIKSKASVVILSPN
jgi:hypothetical protein